MSLTVPAARHRSSASPLALLFTALIVYASLYPFTGWRIPGVSPLLFLGLPWPRWWTWFDLVANFFGYLPLGGLIFLALVRTGTEPRPAWGGAVVLGTLLSFTMEFLQNFLPQRVSSNVDLGLNSSGTLVGATLAYALHARGAARRWQAARDRWFIGRSAGGLALLLLWPAGLLFPLPVPLGVGQVLDPVQTSFAALVQGTPVAAWFDRTPRPTPASSAPRGGASKVAKPLFLETWIEADLDRSALSPAGEFALIALGLLAPCMIAFSIARPGWRRLVLVLGAAALGGFGTTLSTALNFGPQHALAWSTPQALAALGFGGALGALLSAVPGRAALGLGLMALTALVTGVAQAPPDPYFAQSLRAWEQGRFIRFHGAARWVGWLWPYVAIAYLLARLAARDEPSKISG